MVRAARKLPNAESKTKPDVPETLPQQRLHMAMVRAARKIPNAESKTKPDAPAGMAGDEEANDKLQVKKQKLSAQLKILPLS